MIDFDNCRSKTSRRMARISSLRTVWQNACIYNVIFRGYPIPDLPLISLPDLEELTRRAYYLGTKWLSRCQEPRRIEVISAHPSTCIEDVRFVPRRSWLLTLSKGIWSVISAWDIAKGSIKISEWRSPKGALFIAFAVNTDPDSQATLAVSVKQDRSVVKISGMHIHAEILSQLFGNHNFVFAMRWGRQ